MNVSLFSFLFFFFSRAFAIRTSCGELVGTSNDNVNIYYNIPYGNPPIGDLRFQPPQDAFCWTGIYNATTPGNICYQYQIQTNTPYTQSEDCLNINVYTPKDNKDLLPVVFWIYGGSNVIGSQYFYPNLEYLANALQVVLVSPNYRLGTLGYLALKELSQRDVRGVSGNYGITDLVLALKWTQREIKNFGGDPNRITLLGQSSGGTNIFALLSTNANKIFKNIISLSGSPNISMSLSYAEERNKNYFLPSLGCDQYKDVVSCLLSKSGRELTDSMPVIYYPTGVIPSDKGGSNYGGLVIVDGVTVTQSILNLFMTSKNDLGIGMLLQSTYGEIFPLMVNETIAKMNTSTYLSFLKDEYRTQKGWDTNASVVISKLYNNEIQQVNAGYMAYSALSSDVWISGGNGVLGVTAATYWKNSEVYVGSVLYPPSKGYCFFNPKWPITISFHMWDYIAATNSFNYSFVSDCDNSRFVPSTTDVQFMNQMHSHWKAMIYNGSIINSGIYWLPMTVDNLNVGGIHATNVENLIYSQFRGGVWLNLEISPLELNTEKYWMVN